jgi:hypothetical protein
MRRLLVVGAVMALVFAACNGNDEAAEEEEYDWTDQPAAAAASFGSPADGDTVESPVEVVLEATGVTLVPAGIPAAGEAHFHVYVDVGCLESGQVAPGPSPEAEADGVFHLGDGTSSRELELDPGTYELCVQLADGVHTTFGETDTIEITVE